MRESLGVETHGRNESKGVALSRAEVGAGGDTRGAPSTDLNGQPARFEYERICWLKST